MTLITKDQNNGFGVIKFPLCLSSWRKFSKFLSLSIYLCFILSKVRCLLCSCPVTLYNRYHDTISLSVSLCLFIIISCALSLYHSFLCSQSLTLRLSTKGSDLNSLLSLSRSLSCSFLARRLSLLVSS